MRNLAAFFVALGALGGIAPGAQAQAMRTVDPNQAGSMAATAPAYPAPAAREPPPPPEAEPRGGAFERGTPPPAETSRAAEPGSSTAEAAARDASVRGTYQENDVLSAAEGVFGKGAEGLAKIIEDIFKKQGRPTGYIAGREVGGAVVAGVRYGSGTLFHKVEGERPVYWTGPSVGFDLGANGAKTFVLVYNLYDSQELFRRFPAAEGNVYVVGGFTASYMRWKDMVVIPIRLGVGWRLGANVGYMRFTETRKWSPF